METSQTLVNAQISFIDERLRLVYIPLSCYQTHVQNILQLLFPIADENDTIGKAWTARRPFFNISINEVECSIFCSSDLAEQHFGGPNGLTSMSSTSPVPAVSGEEFVVIAVEGEGMEAGQRVLDLTTPLAMASIPIFFITTYFCDYILVPSAARTQVVHALEERGFVFEAVPGGMETHVNVAAHHRNRSSTSSSNPTAQIGLASPLTPPPASVSELQGRTFKLLGKHNIKPQVLSDIRLVQCAGRRGVISHGEGIASSHELALQLGLVKCLAHPPRLLSATFTANDPPAFLLEEQVRQTFFSSSSSPSSEGPTEADVLIGGATNPLVPVVLNLEPLPIEATGIVCGVAGKLAEDTKEGIGSIEMSYLSTSRTGTVLLEESDLDAAINALGAGQSGVDVI